VEAGRAVGVRLRGGGTVSARKAVVSPPPPPRGTKRDANPSVSIGGLWTGARSSGQMRGACVRNVHSACGARARREHPRAAAQVSNASMWDTLRLLPEQHVPASYRASVESTPANPSFMHLHLGFDATGVCVCVLGGGGASALRSPPAITGMSVLCITAKQGTDVLF
jgi:hypothetical protein